MKQTRDGWGRTSVKKLGQPQPIDYTEGMPTLPDSPSALRVAVVGGGAAGFFAAVNIAEKNPRCAVTLFEASPQPLRKVRISGGGRCNLTHACFDPLRLSEFYPRGGRELRSLFARFQPTDTMNWFESRGLRLKIEEDNRVFPASDESQDVIRLFLRLAEVSGVNLRTGARIERILPDEGGFHINVDGRSERFNICVLATGYSPPGWKLAEALGHTVIPPVPSLFPFTVRSPVIEGLQGVSVPMARGALRVSGKNGKPARIQAEGPLLITHTGLSGPLIYRLSAWGARFLADTGYKAALELDFIPEVAEETLKQRLSESIFQTGARKKLGNIAMLEEIPGRLRLALLKAAGADLEKTGDASSRKILHSLTENLKRLPLPVDGKSPSKEEFVSCGGVALKEVDFKTMQSRRVPNLYFAGEILDIDGLTGGFNFQSCWSQAWVVSEALRHSSP